MPPMTNQHLESSQDGTTNISMGPLNRVSTYMSVASVDADEFKDGTIIPAAVEDQNSRLHNLWNQIMDKGSGYSMTSNYTKIEVLLLYHEEADDDLNVKQEIDDLEQVFRDDYHYGVQRSPIRTQHNKKSQTQVNAIVAQWADLHDGPGTLLIVYFAGHGTPDNGQLHLSGRKASPYDYDIEFNQVVWDNTEKNLHNLIADVLQIFDCCFAATLEGRCFGSQTIEYLAACGKDETCPAPGPNSFTSALIWALKGQKQQGGRFTVSRLLNKIKSHPQFQKNEKHPEWKRLAEKLISQRIILHPLLSKEERAAMSSRTKQREKSPHEEEYLLGLRFVFNSEPTELNIQQLAENLNKIVVTCALPMSYIQWGGLMKRESKLIKVVKIMQDVIQEKRQLGKRPRQDSTDDGEVPAFKKAAMYMRKGIQEQVHEEIQEEFAEMTHHEDGKSSAFDSQPRIREPST